MPKFSQVFHISKTQPELDFVDVSLATDNRLFVDPFALSQKLDRWSQDAHHTLVTFFQSIVDDIRSGNEDRARRLLSNLREANETRLGYSARQPQGAGIGDMQAEELFQALSDSAAVRTGFISSLEESRSRHLLCGATGIDNSERSTGTRSTAMTKRSKTRKRHQVRGSWFQSVPGAGVRLVSNGRRRNAVNGSLRNRRSRSAARAMQ